MINNLLPGNTSCRLCGSIAKYFQTGKLLDLQVSYFECAVCGYVQTESPYWLERAYTEAINDSDTGIMIRNQANAKICLATMVLLGKLNGTVVDFAGGYGILVRLLRDYGINALWADHYCKNIVAKGFEYTSEKADLVTAFEVFEHFVNPIDELERLFAIAPNILLSTELIADPAPKLDDWWYYGQNHGQHIGFFRQKSLAKLAHDRGKYYVSDGSSYHLIADQPLNKVTWKMIIKLRGLFPFLFRRSLTKSDHALLS